MFIFGNIIACIFWGLLIAVALTAGIYVLCSILRPDSSSNPISWCVHAVLLILLWVQSALLVGGFKAKSYVNDLCVSANELIQPGKDSAQEIMDAIEDFDVVRDQLADEYPVLSPLLNSLETSAVTAYMEQGHSLADYLGVSTRSWLNSYLWRRVWWALGFIVVAVVILIKGNNSAQRKSGYRTMNKERRSYIKTRRR